MLCLFYGPTPVSKKQGQILPNWPIKIIGRIIITPPANVQEFLKLVEELHMHKRSPIVQRAKVPACQAPIALYARKQTAITIRHSQGIFNCNQDLLFMMTNSLYMKSKQQCKVRTVTIVEDEEDTLDLYSDFLKMKGYTIEVSALTADEILRIILLQGH